MLEHAKKIKIIFQIHSQAYKLLRNQKKKSYFIINEWLKNLENKNIHCLFTLVEVSLKKSKSRQGSFSDWK